MLTTTARTTTTITGPPTAPAETPFSFAFGVGIVLNISFVITEAVGDY